MDRSSGGPGGCLVSVVLFGSPIGEGFQMPYTESELVLFGLESDGRFQIISGGWLEKLTGSHVHIIAGSQNRQQSLLGGSSIPDHHTSYLNPSKSKINNNTTQTYNIYCTSLVTSVRKSHIHPRSYPEAKPTVSHIGGGFVYALCKMRGS